MVVLYFGGQKNALTAFALLAQLDRVFGYEPKGQGFESLAARQKHGTPNGVPCFLLKTNKNSAFAQTKTL